MAEGIIVPLTQVLGDRGKVGNVVKIEGSWSSKVPGSVGAEAKVIPEFDRETAIIDAVKRRQEGRVVQTEFEDHPLIVLRKGSCFNFFVLKGKTLEFIDSMEMDMKIFSKDVSGRFFREWLKKNFPNRVDYADIVSFEDSATMKEVVELLKVCA